MAIVAYNAAINYVKGALSKPKKQDGHNHGDYLIGTHREAPTTNPNCTRLYVKKADAYKRSTPVTSSETAIRTRFAAVARAVKARKADLTQAAADLQAFRAQKDEPGGYKTLKQYLFNICAQAYDQNNG